MSWITGWIAKRALGFLTWKLVAVIVLAAAGYVGVLHLRLNSAQANLKEARAEVIVARSVNETNEATIKFLRDANQSWADSEGMRQDKLDRLKRDAGDAKRNFERLQRELASRRGLDRGSPACAALLDTSLAVCPLLLDRLREAAAGTD